MKDNLYKAFYKGKNIEVQAKTSLEAQELASKYFMAKKRYQVKIMLLAKGDGTPVVHKPLF